MPAEVVESLSPLVFRRRELLYDSGGAGASAAGLGQERVVTCSTDTPWSVSGLLDRTRHPAPGLDGGEPGATGAFRLLDGADLPIKRVVPLAPARRSTCGCPAAAASARRSTRPAEAVLADVVDGYVSLEAARERYGVAIRYVARPMRWCARLRATRSTRPRRPGCARRKPAACLPVLRLCNRPHRTCEFPQSGHRLLVRGKTRGET